MGRGRVIVRDSLYLTAESDLFTDLLCCFFLIVYLCWVLFPAVGSFLLPVEPVD